ncbi:radical SAM protein [Candidatus Thorarchaeota archaeon]|nr:radical SAM protein [Candidatus Thorarchaeota archaeon]TFG97602.1 MAG: radical SAM protein [Candidatus Thorarchaeota archaeon]
MARKIKKLQGGSLLVGDLPQGCILCAKGSKMVLFVTGLCDSSCYYCPLSEEKMGKDVVFADEMPVSDNQDILYETDAIRGEGAGISGGDPLCTLERTLKYIRLLKSKYGHNFHIHLYTSKTTVSQDTLEQLRNAGLDEIRFHPQVNDWSGIERALELGLKVGLEVPAIPGQFEKLQRIAIRAEEIGVSFMNLNELEASETNFEQLKSQGMRLTDLASASIKGSAEVAREILDWAAENLSNLSIHLCSASYKDGVQLRNRLERRLEQTIREFEERDEDDSLLVLGIIRAVHGSQLDEDQLQIIHQILHHQLGVPLNMMNIDTMRRRIEIAPWILDDIPDALKITLEDMGPLEIGIAYEYPSWDRLQTLFEPI